MMRMVKPLAPGHETLQETIIKIEIAGPHPGLESLIPPGNLNSDYLPDMRTVTYPEIHRGRQQTQN